MTAANATLLACPADSEMVVVELDGIFKQAEGAPQGRVFGTLGDVVSLGGLKFAVSLNERHPAGLGQRDEDAAQAGKCDVLRCHLDVATMTATFDEAMNEGDTAYDFRNLTDEL